MKYPTPWTLKNSGVVAANHNGVLAIRPYAQAVDPDVAKFIVLAVNAHDALVAVAKAARRLAGYLYSTQNPGALPQEYRDLEAALALEEKEA